MFLVKVSATGYGLCFVSFRGLRTFFSFQLQYRLVIGYGPGLGLALESMRV